jgi:hypothetical protein
VSVAANSGVPCTARKRPDARPDAGSAVFLMAIVLTGYASAEVNVCGLWG